MGPRLDEDQPERIGITALPASIARSRGFTVILAHFMFKKAVNECPVFRTSAPRWSGASGHRRGFGAA
jgi:hypothetical protein